MTRQRELLFTGCRSIDEAEMLLRAWLREIAADRAREIATVLLSRNADPDLLDEVASEAARAVEVDIDRECQQFRRALAPGGKSN
jgi:hypothetical protein